MDEEPESAGTESLLSEYLKNSRAGGEKLQRSEVAQRVERIFEELKLPWQRRDGRWQIDSDVGQVSAGLDDDEDVLTFSQVINELSKPDKKSGEFYGALLRQNFYTTGACFAVMDDGDGNPLLLILGRISANNVDTNEVALTLQSLFELSAVFD